MSFINNLSVRVKLLILTVPLSIALIIACVVMGVEMNSVEEEVTGIYYDTLFTVSDNLINADRDFYQARVADYKGDKQDFDDNMQQTIICSRHMIAYMRLTQLLPSHQHCITKFLPERVTA